MRADVLDLRALASSRRVEGFDGLVLQGLVRPEWHDALRRAFPDDGFREVEAASRGDAYLGGRLATRAGDAALPDPWAQLLEEARAPAYAAALGREAGVDLAGATLRTRFLRYPPDGGFLAAHHDHQRGKRLTQVVYANLAWRPEWGGRFEMLPEGEDEPLARLLPTIHYSVVNRSTPRARHRVERVGAAAPEPRLALLLEWYDPPARPATA